MKTKAAIISVIILVAVIFGYLDGFRFDGLSAARANSFVPKDSTKLDEVKYSWGNVYIFDSPEKPITAISKKY